ncbi:cation-transporting ATPase [Spiroplasma sabaudiense Ar-1343]|uniref:Cation-transporting ATPase n=1 Tax=Spiroplasma sabaudiense Ar-1343 TaxID=1276257 RepID=W6AJI5_9MOLU|nr:cation-translocating P-type ATPase [Spiroplasma sabaudiense]AHI53879.1 cation-transporting ATPase [Spiroplasma sabaudiense Ar-1343]
MKEICTKTKKELAKSFETDLESGLTQEEAQIRLEKNGRNELPKGKVTHWVVIFLKTLLEPLQLILLAAAIISVVTSLVASNWEVSGETFVDFIVIICIVIIDGVLETVQEVKARKSMDSLKSFTKPHAIVIRSGLQQDIDASELVIGDLVVLEAGKYVPADLIIIEASDLMVDESILSGESVPSLKTSHHLAKETAILADMKNAAFMSTFTTAGRAIGMVVKTGIQTEIGKIAESINENDEAKTPLEKKLIKFSYWIALAALVIGVLIFLTMFLKGNSKFWPSYLMVAITLAIGVIPECLAAVVSISLSFSTKRMARENVIVKKLASVETLGSVNVICTDKTGTLTVNRMTIKKIMENNEVLDSNAFLKKTNSSQRELFLQSLVLPNDSVTQGKERIGDPTELALVDFAELAGLDEQIAREKWTRIDEIPFDSERKLMTTVNNIQDKPTTFTKGAIDEILKVCDSIFINNKIRKITEEDKRIILKQADDLSQEALRILAFAYNTNYDKTKNKAALEKNLIYLGSVAMIDPVRASAVEAVREAHEAGINVVMITGDHATTALAIAKDLNLAFSEYEVISSDRLEQMSDLELSRIITQIKVFARVNPEHKVRIVKALQDQGNIVSMTGDGVNDAPSLSKADIGVAMGITGTDVAKQASDVILTDDNFKTIIKGVGEGRNVYQKIRRAITFVISVNLANVLAIFILSIINDASPVEATNILWINLIVESVLAITIGMGPNDYSLMKIKPLTGKHSLFEGLWKPMFKICLFSTGAAIAGFYLGMSFTPAEFYEGKDTWYLFLKDQSTSLSERVRVMSFGRTAMFIVMTISPCFYVNLIKLSNWKANPKFQFNPNVPLVFASIFAASLNIIVLFIPGLNDVVLMLNPIEYWNAHNWYMIIEALGIAMIPGALILLTDSLVFFTYHHLPKSWERNRRIAFEMVQNDNKKKVKKTNSVIEKDKKNN